MKSVFYQMPNTHSVTIGIYVRCGLHCEKDKKAGITHLLEHMYFRKLGNLVEKSLEEIVMILNDVKDNITKRDLDISLPFYTVNQIFDEDDTEKMNFKLAYKSFILNRKTANYDMKNDNETRTRLQKEAQILFRNQNISAVFMGKINEFSKKNVWKILKRL